MTEMSRQQPRPALRQGGGHPGDCLTFDGLRIEPSTDDGSMPFSARDRRARSNRSSPRIDDIDRHMRVEDKPIADSRNFTQESCVSSLSKSATIAAALHPDTSAELIAEFALDPITDRNRRRAVSQ